MSVPLIAILLCTYQGERFLVKQLDSIEQQTYPHWIMYVSDDGSTDHTLSLLKTYAAKWEQAGNKKLFLMQGPQRGFAANFISLIKTATIQADFYALADQDDIWEPDKLNRAVQALRHLNVSQPNLYCTRTQLINEQDEAIGYTTLYSKPPCFANALVQNIAGGNTMVFNEATRHLLLKTPATLTLPFHDWWIYLLVTGCGGQVYYDAHPSLRYRQHDNNQIGANQSYLALLLRLRLLLGGEFARWNDENLQGLISMKEWLTPANQQCLVAYQLARRSSFIPRLLGFLKARVFRQTLMGNLKLLGAVLLKKV